MLSEGVRHKRDRYNIDFTHSTAADFTRDIYFFFSKAVPFIFTGGSRTLKCE